VQAENEVKAAEARVAAAWEELLASDLSCYSGELRSLVEKASRIERLRRMYPFLSVGRLCFSRCTEYPYFVPVWIAPMGGENRLFSVQTPANRRGWIDGAEVYRGPADRAIREAAETLTGDDLPALLGNAESLGLGALAESERSQPNMIDQPGSDPVIRYMKVGAFCAFTVPAISAVISWGVFPDHDGCGKAFTFPSLIVGIRTVVIVSLSVVPFGMIIGAIVGRILKHRETRAVRNR